MRRTPEDIRTEADSILALLRARGTMRAEELAEALDVESRHLEKPLKLLRRGPIPEVLVAGQKRWTTYAIPVRTRAK